MKILHTLWGLLFDDTRLAVTLLTALVIAAILSLMNFSTVAAFVIWLGLLASLYISIEHQLQLKKRKLK